MANKSYTEAYSGAGGALPDGYVPTGNELLSFTSDAAATTGGVAKDYALPLSQLVALLNTYTNGNLNIALIQSADGAFPQSVTQTADIIGTSGLETQISASGTLSDFYVDMRGASRLRTLMFRTSAGTGQVTLTLTPSSDLIGTTLGAPITVATGVGADASYDLSFETFPYAHYYKLDVQETSGNTLDMYVSLMYRGGE